MVYKPDLKKLLKDKFSVIKNKKYYENFKFECKLSVILNKNNKFIIKGNYVPVRKDSLNSLKLFCALNNSSFISKKGKFFFLSNSYDLLEELNSFMKDKKIRGLINEEIIIRDGGLLLSYDIGVFQNLHIKSTKGNPLHTFHTLIIRVLLIHFLISSKLLSFNYSRVIYSLFKINKINK